MKHKSILFILIFAILNNLYSQSTDIKKTYKYIIGVTVNQGMSSKSKLTNEEAPKYTFLSVGFNIKRSLSDKFVMQSGIIFNDKGYSIKKYYGAVIPEEPPSKKHLKTRQLYIDIPMLCQYNLLKRSRIVYYISGGLVGNIFISDNTGLVYDYYNNTEIIIYHEEDYKPFTVSVAESLCFDLNLTKRFTLSVAQVFQHALMNFQKDRKTFKDYDGTTYNVTDPKFTFIPYFIGINISLNLKF